MEEPSQEMTMDVVRPTVDPSVNLIMPLAYAAQPLIGTVAAEQTITPIHRFQHFTSNQHKEMGKILRALKDSEALGIDINRSAMHYKLLRQIGFYEITH
uniref:Uncharacterized protein n=1 Tax=Romanomermis culicivorax TaxID=13658 RepID=A0A915KNF0_ROMCU